MSEGFTRVPFNDIAAFEAAITDDIAAVVIIPVQGEEDIPIDVVSASVGSMAERV